MRIIIIYACLRVMKTSVSALVEEYFKILANSSQRENILQLVEPLPDPKIDKDADLKDLYYSSF